MQTIYLMDIRILSPFFDSCMALVRPERREKVLSYCFFDDQLRCLAGGLLIERIAKGQEVLYTENGKPFLPEGPYVNISHSGDFVCLAVCGSAPVGIDIEQHRDEDFLCLAKTVFHPSEYDFFMRVPGAARFFELWTLKESYIKMIGSGLSIEPSSFCVLPEKKIFPQGEIPFMQNIYSQNLDTHNLNSFIEGYSMAICAREPIKASIINWSCNSLQ